MKRLKNRIIFEALKLTVRAGHSLGLERGRRAGRRLGRILHRLAGRHRVVAETQIARAFSDLDPERRCSILQQMAEHLGESMFEIINGPHLDDRTLREVTRIEGSEHLEHAVRENRGVLLFSAHCGNWEWMCVALHLMGYEVNTIARDIYDSRINQLLVEFRERFGVRSIGRGSDASALEIMRTLKRGGILAALIDQSIKVESVLVPFFGEPAPTAIGPARLAVRSGAMAISGLMERRDGKLVARFEPAIDTRVVDDPFELTRLMTDSIERQIRRAPAQWVWIHKRWRVRKRQGVGIPEEE